MGFQYDMYVAKLSPTGGYVWAVGYGGLGDDKANAIAVDGSGDVLVVGDFQQTASFGGSTFTSAGGYDIFVAKYSGVNGGHLWSRSGGGTGDDSAKGVAVDAAGNVVVTGEFNGTATIAGASLVASYNTGLFLVKYTSAGNPVWSRGFSALISYGYGSGRGVAIDSVGNIVVAGVVSGAVGIDGNYLGNGSGDILLAKFAPGGSALWAKSYGDLNNDSGQAVSIGAGDNILATGLDAMSVDFGTGAMASTCWADGFVVKLTP
jgi:hypothetical protein